jgi:excisionase family DNA binding protein
MTSPTIRTPRFLAAADIAELLKVSTRTVRRWIERGELHAHCIHGRYRIAEEDLRLFLVTSRR